MFTVNINFFNIEDHLVEVSTTTTNYDLKLLLSEMTATDPKSFNLIFEGNILNDNIQLIEQGIVPDCFVDVELTRQAGALHRLKIALGDENLVTETHFNSILADTSDVTLVTDFLLSGVVTDQRLLITGLVRGRRNLNILILETLLKHIPADVRRITVALAIPIRCDIKVIEMLLKYDVPFGCIQNLSESDADLISLLFQYGWKLPVSHYLPIAQQFIKSFPVRYLDFKSPTVSVRGAGIPGIFYSARYADEELCEIAFENIQNIDIEDGKKMTPVMHAACMGNICALKKLISKGADLRSRDSDGVDALYHAIRSGKCIFEMSKLLIDSAGLNEEITNPDGATCLNVACNGSVVDENVLSLLLRNCSPSFANKADNSGYTAAMNTITAGNISSYELLLKFGVAAPEMSFFQRTFSLTCKSKSGKMKLFKYLLHNYPSLLDHPDKSGATPLLLAARNGNLQLIEELLKLGADPSIPDRNGCRPHRYLKKNATYTNS